MYLLKEICFFQGQQPIALSDVVASALAFDIKSLTAALG